MGQAVKRTSAAGRFVRRSDVTGRFSMTGLMDERGAVKVDDVAEVFPDDVPLKRAYGTGAALSANSSNQLLKAANDVISAFAESGKKVAAAGVNARRITALEKLRDTLSAADSGQREAAAQKKGATADGATLRKSIDKRVSLLRAKLAKTVSKSASGSTARRHAVTPRAKTPLGIAT